MQAATTKENLKKKNNLMAVWLNGKIKKKESVKTMRMCKT